MNLPQIMSKTEDIWLDEGYLLFSLEGPKGVKIERLAKRLQRNKSAFYYFFGTAEIFTSQLLEQHLAKTGVMSEKMREATTLEALTEILIHHKTDLLFNKQLRVNRENPAFEACFHKTNEFVGDAFLPVWSTIIGLKEDSDLARLVLKLSVENFFLKITNETFHPNWLKDYFNDFRFVIKKIKKSS
ncbi:MAG TPA: TetR/AcrR family transcriptional regulator [Microscillaceae bacterium]|nr:TetR/AcrR family transcriptional regulator [Microscillaceae bacterium]